MPFYSGTNGGTFSVSIETSAALNKIYGRLRFTEAFATSGAQIYFFTSGAGDFPSSTLPAGVTMCGCQYLSWGFWGGNLDRPGNQRDSIHLATWVFGKIDSAVTINSLTGTATYNGHVIGTSVSGTINAPVRTRVGNLQYNVNFNNLASSSGTITNYDGGNYTMTGVLLNGLNTTHRISGNINGSSGTAIGRLGTFDGSFFRGGSDPAAEMGGTLKISGIDYQSTAIFAAKKLP